MHAMQYEITLPGDYDMAIIRRRVAERGAATDAYAGLGLKAYAIRERGVDGSPVNQYAPFYLWATPEGMNSFLWGPPFAGLSADFGRPQVNNWTGLAFHPGPARESDATMATRSAQPIPVDADPRGAIDAALAQAEVDAVTPDVHSTAVVIDPSRWELVRFTLWDGRPPPGSGIAYEVLHVSCPGLDDLSVGRHW
jgi:hypothetical protein